MSLRFQTSPLTIVYSNANLKFTLNWKRFLYLDQSLVTRLPGESFEVVTFNSQEEEEENFAGTSYFYSFSYRVTFFIYFTF